MRIAIIATLLSIYDKDDSGIGAHYRLLADSLAGDHDVHVFYNCPSVLAKRVEERLGVLKPKWKFTLVCNPVENFVSRLPFCSWIVKEIIGRIAASLLIAYKVYAANLVNRYDIIEAHSYVYPCLVLGLLPLRPPIVTRVSTLQIQLDAYSAVSSRVRRINWLLENAAIKVSNALVTHSRSHLHDLSQFLDSPTIARFQIVEHAVARTDCQALCCNRRSFSNRPFRFLYVGRFETRKGIDILVDSIAMLGEQVQDCEFHFVGAYAKQSDALSLAQRSMLEKTPNVYLYGNIGHAQLQEMYCHSDLLVFPSRYESFGLVIAEAMSYGLPALAFRVGGIPSVIAHKSSGYLVDTVDSQNLARAMAGLASNPELLKILSEGARASYLARFSPDVLAANSLKMYEEVFSGTHLGTDTVGGKFFYS